MTTLNKSNTSVITNLPDLEDLLNSVINPDEFDNCKKYLHNKVSYLIPNSIFEFDEFDELKISVNNGSFNQSTQAFYINSQNSDSKAIFTLSPSSCYQESCIELYIYRVGTSTPIYRQVERSDNDISFEIDNTILTPGDYIAIIPKLSDHMCPNLHLTQFENHAIYHFSVFPSGSEIEAPVITSVSPSVSPLPINNEDGTLKLKVHFLKSTPDIKHFSAVCIDKDMNIIDRHYAIVKARRKYFEMEFSNSLLWKPETHSILISLNGEPQYKIDFNLIDHKNIDIHWSTLSLGSPSHTLCLMLSDLEKHWDELRSIPGTKQLQEAALQYFHIARYNQLQSLSGYNYRYFCHNFTIATDHGRLNDENISQFLHCTTGRYYHTNCHSCANLLTPSDNSNRITDFESDIYDIDVTPNRCLYLTDISGLCGPYSAKFVDNLIHGMNNCPNYSVILLGSKNEIDKVFKAHPRLKSFFPSNHCLEILPLTPFEIVNQVHKIIQKQDLVFNTLEQQTFALRLMNLADSGMLKLLCADDVTFIVKSSMLVRFTSRLKKQQKAIADITFDDIDISLFANEKPANYDYLCDLNKMVGLNDIKDSLSRMFQLTRFNQMRHKLGLKSHDNGCHHMVFTGNPGTGKTTVAKIIGKIFHNIGVLSKGDVVIAERTNLVGRYIGETEFNMRNILKQAQGNVLFIDEAYSLISSKEDSNDFGKRVIESLLTVLSQENPDMIVILAGYGKEMDDLLNINPGLNGRFPHRFNFSDYSADELGLIAENIIADEQYRLTPEAHSLLINTIQHAVNTKDKNFCNARWVTQLITNEIIPAVANRLISSNAVIDIDSCQTITVDDVRHARNKVMTSTQVMFTRPKVGFSA